MPWLPNMNRILSLLLRTLSDLSPCFSPSSLDLCLSPSLYLYCIPVGACMVDIVEHLCALLILFPRSSLRRQALCAWCTSLLKLCDHLLFPLCVLVKLLSRVQLLGIPWTVAYQAPPSMEFPRQEYWSGLPFPSPGNLPDPGIKPRSPAL